MIFYLFIITGRFKSKKLLRGNIKPSSLPIKTHIDNLGS